PRPCRVFCDRVGTLAWNLRRRGRVPLRLAVECILAFLGAEMIFPSPYSEWKLVCFSSMSILQTGSLVMNVLLVVRVKSRMPNSRRGLPLLGKSAFRVDVACNVLSSTL